MIDADYNAWKANPNAARLILCEVTAQVAGVETTLYFSTESYVTGPAETPPNQYYTPALSKDLTVSEQLSLSGDSAGLSIGDVEILDENGALVYLKNYIWSDRSCKLYLGGPGWARVDFRLEYDGITDDIAPKGRKAWGLKLRDKMQLMNADLSGIKVGGTGVNKDAVRPHVFGEVYNMTPVHDTGVTYMVNNGAIELLPEVRDNGLKVDVTADLANGKFTLVRAPEGEITCDVQGSSTGGTSLQWAAALRWRVRVTSIVLNDVQSLHITEFQFREAVGVPQLFSGGTATASNSNPTFPAANAADNNLSTTWVHNTTAFTTSNPEWWEYAYATSKGIAEYTITANSTNSTRPTAWELQYWNGSAWIVADSRSGIAWVDNVPQTFSVAKVITTTPGSYASTVGALVQRLATGYGLTRLTSADLDTAQLAAFETANPQQVGMLISERVNVLNACKALASSVGAQLSMSRAGKLRLLRITAPGTSIREIGPSQMVAFDITPTTRPPVIAAVQLNYAKNWTEQTTLSTGLSAADKENFKTVWLPALASDSAVAATYKLTTEVPAQDTMLLKRTEALAEAARRLAIWKVQKQVYQFTCYAEMFDLQLGDTVTVTHPRYSLVSVPALVVSLAVTWARGRVIIGVLI